MSSMLDKILARHADAFAKVQPPAPALPDVAALAAALRAEPAAWFDVRDVIGGDREAMDAALAALQAELGRPVRLWAPRRALLSGPKGQEDEMLTSQEAAKVLNNLRELWKGSAEAPAVRSAVGYFALAFRAKDEAFDMEEFWASCGYSEARS